MKKLRLAVLSAVLLPALLLAAGAPLSPRHKEWLEKDVHYIITKEERDAFLNLTSDEAREKFIDRFWEIRNPTFGAPTNPYKEEHYRRLAYADQNFGKETGTPGWKTEMGATYITLGEPQQRARYYGQTNVRPMEIWFYQSPSPALPAFFYVIFYQREAGGDFRMYSPYANGPEALASPAGGTENNRTGALRMIDQALGREVARTTLSLIPDEPIDFANARGSLRSDIMLGRIRNLANDPLQKADLERRRLILERVSSKVIFGDEFLGVTAVPLRDAEGNVNVHYLLRLNKPEDFAVAESPDGRWYYSVSVDIRVLGPGNKLIFSDQKTAARYFDKKQLDQIKGRTFGYEGWLPLAPGKYKIEFLLTNTVLHAAYRGEREITVPEVKDKALHLTPVVAFSESPTMEGRDASLEPFGVAGVKFEPLAGQQLHLQGGGVLKFFYQIWTPPESMEARRGRKLQVEYAYGRPAATGDRKIIKDEAPREQFDVYGSMINGKRLPLPANVGNYVLTVTVIDPETLARAYSNLNFTISSVTPNIIPWNLTDESLAEELRNGTLDYQRGLCFLAGDKKDTALEWFKRALTRNPDQEEARAKLVDLYFSRQAYAELTELSRNFKITAKTSEETLLHVAEALEKSGQMQKAVDLLEEAARTKAPSGPLCFVLSSYYQRLGNARKAADWETRGKSAAASPSGLL